MEEVASNVAVIAERSFSREIADHWQGIPSEIVGRTESVLPGLEKLLALQPDGLVVYGSDRLVSRVVTAYHTRLRQSGYPLRLLPMAVGDLQFVARAAGVEQTPGQVIKALRAGESLYDWPRKAMSCLKISSSMEPAAQYGFSFGIGWPFAAFDAYERKAGTPGGQGVSIAVAAASFAKDWARSGVRLGVAESSKVKNRVSVDYKARGEGVGYVMASTLEQSWFGRTATRGHHNSLVMGDSPVELLKRAAASRTVERVRRVQHSGEGFERAHLDGFAGYVLDGMLFKPEHEFVVQVSQGPQVHFVGTRSSTLSRLKGYFSGGV